MRHRALLWVPIGVAMLSAGAPAADFLGPESCKGCHAAAYALWRESKHARALEALTADQQRDARCTACHSPNQNEQHVAAVSCETCHGGGQFYSPAYVMKDSELVRLVGLLDPSERSCRSCHDASTPSLEPFVFAEKLKAMDHWSADRKKRAAAGPPHEAAPGDARAQK